MAVFGDVSEIVTGFALDKVVVFDTETTGVDTSVDEILSIGICDGFGNVLLESYVRPRFHSEWPDAQRVNGISPAMVQSAPTLDEIAPEIRKHLLGNKMVVGYNVFFDMALLEKWGVVDAWPMSVFDVMREYATVHGTKLSMHGDGYKWSKLSDCAASFGYEFSAHDSAEDAKATAWCYRALLSDEAYLRRKLPPRIDSLKRIGLGQIKASTENILAFVDEGMTSPVCAELRLGVVTRGQNKGAARYECFVSGKCVGVSSKDAVDRVRKYCFLDESDQLPESIACEALMSAAGDRATCVATMCDDGSFGLRVFAMASADRKESAFGYRAIDASASGPVERPNAATVSGLALSPFPCQAELPVAKKKGVLSWAALSAFLVLCAVVGLTMVGQTDLFAWALTELLFAGGAYLSARRAVCNRRFNDRCV